MQRSKTYRAAEEAFDKNERHREQTLTSLRKVRQLIEDLGLLTPSYRRLWKTLGLWQANER